MSARLPIIDMVKQAFFQVTGFGKGLGITVAYLVGVTAFAAAVLMVGFGMDLSVLQEIADGKQPELTEVSPDFFGGSFLILLLAILFGYAWIFNMWIRFGAFGHEGAFFPTASEGIKATLVTAVKLILIGVVLGLVALVAVSILMVIGLIDIEAAAEGGPSLVSAITSNLIFLAVVSGVYSLFSSNLTQTAIGTTDEEIGPPSVPDFAIVLFLINAVFLVPLLIVQEILPVVVVLILQFVGSIWTTSAVPLAHGLRYDWRRQAFASGEPENDGFPPDQDDN